MLSHHEALTRIKAAKLVAILRHVPTEKLDGVVEALMAGGVRVLEVTLRTECALEAIRAIAKEVPDAIVGAGTVTNVEQLKAVTEAGAQFAISPGLTESLL